MIPFTGKLKLVKAKVEFTFDEDEQLENNEIIERQIIIVFPISAVGLILNQRDKYSSLRLCISELYASWDSLGSFLF